MNELFNLATRFVVAVEGIASALSYPVPKRAADESNVVVVVPDKVAEEAKVIEEPEDDIPFTDEVVAEVAKSRPRTTPDEMQLLKDTATDLGVVLKGNERAASLRKLIAEAENSAPIKHREVKETVADVVDDDDLFSEEEEPAETEETAETYPVKTRAEVKELGIVYNRKFGATNTKAKFEEITGTFRLSEMPKELYGEVFAKLTALL